MEIDNRHGRIKMNEIEFGRPFSKHALAAPFFRGASITRMKKLFSYTDIIMVPQNLTNSRMFATNNESSAESENDSISTQVAV